jgi:hypothetical protein
MTKFRALSCQLLLALVPPPELVSLLGLVPHDLDAIQRPAENLAHRRRGPTRHGQVSTRPVYSAADARFRVHRALRYIAAIGFGRWELDKADQQPLLTRNADDARWNTSTLRGVDFKVIPRERTYHAAWSCMCPASSILIESSEYIRAAPVGDATQSFHPCDSTPVAPSFNRRLRKQRPHRLNGCPAPSLTTAAGTDASCTFDAG